MSLEEGQLVIIEKTFSGKIPVTRVGLTPEGRTEIDRHWRQLDKLRVASLEWQPE